MQHVITCDARVAVCSDRIVLLEIGLPGMHTTSECKPHPVVVAEILIASRSCQMPGLTPSIPGRPAGQGYWYALARTCSMVGICH